MTVLTSMCHVVGVTVCDCVDVHVSVLGVTGCGCVDVHAMCPGGTWPDRQTRQEGGRRETCEC